VEHRAALPLYPGVTRLGDATIPVNSKLSSGDFARYTLVAVVITGLVYLGWKVIDVALMAFGGIVFASVLRALANLVKRYLKLPGRWSIVAVLLLLFLLFGALSWAFGAQLIDQAEQLRTRLPAAVATVQQRIEEWSGGRFKLSALQPPADTAKLVGNVAKVAGVTVGFVGHAVVMFFVGLYLAFDPDVYVRGVVRLFPVDHRTSVHEALMAAGEALRKWLIGQLASMSIVGVLTAIGLAIAGVPLALALGVLAGLLDFIPVVGPVIAFVPGVVLALSVDPHTAAWAAAVYLGVQQLENHVIVPLAQRWSVNLPPAVSILSILTLGLLFGVMGVLFGMPLTVVAMVLIKKLYVEGSLEKRSRTKTSH
jgi:predicted PurR-regulated permease PerM